MSTTENYWKKCSNCKSEIGFRTPYQRCSVTTCNHERTGMQFCSVSCWSAHVPIYRHRDAWAIEETSPSKSQAEINEMDLQKQLPKAPEAPPQAQKVFVSSRAGISAPQLAPTSARLNPANTEDVLVVVSKLKSYIKDRSDMNTSADVMETLSDYLRRQCDDAIEHARSDGRKTVMARDFVNWKKSP